MFEDGKSVEDYMSELSEVEKFVVDSEPAEEAPVLEDVVEAPVRNEKKKEVKKPESPKPVAVPKQPVPEPQVVEAPVPVVVEPVEVIEEAASEPTPEPVAPQQTQQPQFKGIDDYIMQTGHAIGVAAERNFIESSYRNILAVVNGQVKVVPVEQPQPTPAPTTKHVAPPKDDVAIKIAELEQKIKMFEQQTTPTVAPPVIPKVAESKPKKGITLKLLGLAILLCLVVGLAIGLSASLLL